MSLPVAYADAYSMFLLVDVLGKHAELLTHRTDVLRRRTKRDLAVVSERLSAMSLDALLCRPELYPQLRGVGLVVPDWDVLPTKARYSASEEETTAVSPVAYSAEPLWLPFASIVESKLRTGGLPRIIEAHEWIPRERLPGLGRTRIGGDGALIDLSDDPEPGAFTDPLLGFAAERARLKENRSLSPAARERMRSLYKTIGVSIGYGAEVEFNRRPRRREFSVWGPGGRLRANVRPEHPGWLCYPAFATFTVAGSRLLMAIFERLVEEAGGGIVWMDTDGGCVPVTLAGRLIPCPGGPHRDNEGRGCIKTLSFEEFQAIRRRFEPLAEAAGFVPIGPDGIRSVFKLEGHNLGPDGSFDGGLECYAVSVKNYMLFRRDANGDPINDPRSKFSAHAMGNLVSPIDPETNDAAWISQAWLWWIRTEEGRAPAQPAWVEIPAAHAMVLAHPSDYRRVRRKLNRGRSYDEGFKPFDTMLLPHQDRFMAGGDDPAQLLAPWEPDPRRWGKLSYLDPASGRSFTITVRKRTGTYRDWQRKPGSVFVDSMRSYLERHFTHPEPASLGPDGKPCARETRGVLSAQPIFVRRQIVTGKDTNRVQEVRVGWTTRDTERQMFGKTRGKGLRRKGATCMACGRTLVGRQRGWCAVCRSLPGRERQRLLRQVSEAATEGATEHGRRIAEKR